MHLLRFKMQWANCTVRQLNCSWCDRARSSTYKRTNRKRQEKLKYRQGSRRVFFLLIGKDYGLHLFWLWFCPLKYGNSVEYFGVLLSQLEENWMHISKLLLPFLLGQMPLLWTEKSIACTTLKKDSSGMNLELG